MPDFSTDPYTQVYNALWNLLAGSPEFPGLVRARNRIDWQGDNADPLKRNIQDADTPEVEILQTGGTIDLWATGDTTLLSETYQIGLHTTELRPNKGLNKLKWAILRALAMADANLGLDFVLNTTVMGVTDTMNNAASNRGTSGWTAMVQVRVEMKVSRALLKGVAQDG